MSKLSEFDTYMTYVGYGASVIPITILIIITFPFYLLGIITCKIKIFNKEAGK